MNPRERILTIMIALLLGGLILWMWGVQPMLATFTQLDEEVDSLERELKVARKLVDNETKLRSQWLGYERAGMSRSLEEADAQASGALLTWAEDAGFEKVNLSDGDDRIDRDQPYGEIVYTLQTAGQLRGVSELLWSIRHSPFPLRVEKCVLDQRNPEAKELQIALTVSTLFSAAPQREGVVR